MRMEQERGGNAMGHGVNCRVHQSGPCDCYLSEERDAVAGFLDSQRGMLSRTIGQIKDEAKAELVKRWQDEDVGEFLDEICSDPAHTCDEDDKEVPRWACATCRGEAIARAKVQGALLWCSTHDL